MGMCAALKGISGAGSNPRTATSYQPRPGRLNGRCPWPFPYRARTYREQRPGEEEASSLERRNLVHGNRQEQSGEAARP